MASISAAFKKKSTWGTILLATAVSVTGCSTKNETSATNGASAPASTAPASTAAGTNSPQASAQPQEGMYPIANADKPITLKVWTAADPILKYFKNYGEVLAFQEMEKATGVKIEWIHPSAGQLQEPFNLMIASRDLPDVILYPWGNSQFLAGGADKYVKDGVIIPLNEYMKNAPDYAKVLESYPEIKKRVTNDQGEMDYISLMQPDLTMRTYNGFMIRQDWLDKAGMPMPRSTDDLYKTLKAFQDKDVNGNGKKDEYISATGMDKGILGIEKLLYPFGATAGNDAFIQRDGKVVYSPADPAFKEGVAYLNKLYKEGLLDPEYMLNDNTKLQQKYTNGTVSASYSSAGRVASWAPGIQAADANAALAPIPSLTGPDGKGYWFEGNTANITNPGVSLAITTANKHPAETMAWWNWVFTQAGKMAFNYGKEGVTYEMVDGKPKFTDMITKDPQGRTQNEMLTLTAPAAGLPTLNDLEATKLQKSEVEWKAFQTWGDNMPDNSGIMSPVTFNEQEMDVMTAKKPAIDDYQKQMLDKFITGRVSLDKWETEFVPQLKKLGIDEVTAAYQSALERYNQR
ncbi:extracellular solute-binding protein [Cohnella ginsengisoli]|uniref:Extracellular solute-binding protein n=1 Tax=Cohnella ginsengisoli TaxID=425004 RepID=A0A9X4QN02_9BACL|nr:extracellular solute-binding protein [Cohnella ginsengisoli]MDG0792649.1 extracellular solute-binding protein [Cohnella ginsengisoli]